LTYLPAAFVCDIERHQTSTNTRQQAKRRVREREEQRDDERHVHARERIDRAAARHSESVPCRPAANTCKQNGGEANNNNNNN
jgi:hypothetical protein